MKESFGDRHPVKSGENFAKQWTMRNDGKTEWPADTTLIMTNGDEMKAKDVSIGSVKPDSDIEFKVELVAPGQPGRYSTFFRMRTGENYRFGHKIWCDILVEDKVEESKVEAIKVEEVKVEPPMLVA